MNGCKVKSVTENEVTRKQKSSGKQQVMHRHTKLVPANPGAFQSAFQVPLAQLATATPAETGFLSVLATIGLPKMSMLDWAGTIGGLAGWIDWLCCRGGCYEFAQLVVL